MDLLEFQKSSRQTAIYGQQKSVDGLTYAVLALCGETGELANKLKKALRGGTKPDALVLADELGDVLWYVAAVAEEIGIDLNEVARMNFEKLAARRAAKTTIG